MHEQPAFAELCTIGNIYMQHLAHFEKFKKRVHDFAEKQPIPSFKTIESQNPEEFRVRFAGNLIAIRFEFDGNASHSRRTPSRWKSYRVDELASPGNSYIHLRTLLVDAVGNVTDGPEEGSWPWVVGSDGLPILHAFLRAEGRESKVVKLQGY